MNSANIQQKNQDENKALNVGIRSEEVVSDFGNHCFQLNAEDESQIRRVQEKSSRETAGINSTFKDSGGKGQ